MPDLDRRPARGQAPSQGGSSTSLIDSIPSNDAMLGVVPNDAGTAVQGPMGKVFNRILGVKEDRSDTGSMAFTREQLRQYLDSGLQLAEGEFFRGTKLDGVTDALMQKLDKDGSGTVTWEEFRAFRKDILATVAPGAPAGAGPDQLAGAAGGRFDKLDSSRDGAVGFDEIEGSTARELPAGTDHADLVAQLGARIALDAVDTDERGKKVKDRRMSRDEWSKAARGL